MKECLEEMRKSPQKDIILNCYGGRNTILEDLYEIEKTIGNLRYLGIFTP